MAIHTNFNVLFVPRAKKNKKQSKEKLYARVTVNGERVEISLSRDVSEGLFDPKAQRCLGNSTEARNVNDFLSIVLSRLNEIRKGLMIEGKDVSAERIRQIYKGEPDPNEVRLPQALELYEEHNRKFKELIGTPKHSAATHKRHITSIRHVKQFLKDVYLKDDIAIDKVNFKFLCDYEHYLKVVRGCNHNSTMKYIKNLGKVIRLAIGEGYLTINPFDKFKLTYETVERVRLTQEEVDRIVNINIPERRLDRVRDMFVFCIHAGTAYADVRDLQMNHISKDAEGTKWITKKRQKTGVEFKVPILKINKKIIKKYKDHPERINEGKVIPNISNQNYNGYLKEVAIRCGIDKELSSHIARHTFATTITLDNGVPLEVISKMLGHTDTKTTQIYAKMQEKAIKQGMSNLLNPKKSKKKKKKKSKGKKGGKSND